MSSANNLVCFEFAKQGYCVFGNRCRYHHSRLVHYDTAQSLQPRRHYNQHYRQYANSDNNHNHYQSTYRYSFMDSFVDYSKETIIFDIDGTIADIRNRLSLFPGSNPDGTRTRQEWDMVLNGDYYRYDRVIDVAYAYLKYIESLNKYNIVYLSGRRSTTVPNTREWLFNVNGYPKGFIIHRLKGISGKDFKRKQLRTLSTKLNIIAYFGDRVIDDCISAINVGVRPILVTQNKWLNTKQINGGISQVMNDVSLSLSVEDIEIIRNSKFWTMPYNDLIPVEFATDMFYSEYGELVSSNGEYLQEVIDEPNDKALLNENKNDVDDEDNNEMVSKQNENENEDKSDVHASDNADDDDDNNDVLVENFMDNVDAQSNDTKKDIERRIHLCHEQQQKIQQQYRWIPNGQSIFH